LEPKKSAAAHTYDKCKDKWDKYDVEAALAEVDKDSDRGHGSEEEGTASGSLREELPPEPKVRHRHLHDIMHVSIWLHY
jgi:hypothetical protein